MGLFDKLKEITNAVNKVANTARNVEHFVKNPQDEAARIAENAARRAANEAVNKAVNSVSPNTAVSSGNYGGQQISLAPSRTVTEEDCADDKDYVMTFSLSKDFVRFESHAGEVPVSFIYAPGKTEETAEFSPSEPCFGIYLDNTVYRAVESYKNTGSIPNAFEVYPIEGLFLFSAKIPYYDEVMYFYGFDRCGGYWENNGIGIQYKRSLMGTPFENALINAVNEAARSYTEEVKTD